MRNEWPSFSIVPEPDVLPEARPRGQTLARFIWWNGEIADAEKQSVHYYSNALHYGTAVFEGIRAYNTPKGPAVFRLREHIERLFDSARVFGFREVEIQPAPGGLTHLHSRCPHPHGEIEVEACDDGSANSDEWALEPHCNASCSGPGTSASAGTTRRAASPTSRTCTSTGCACTSRR